MIGVHVSDGDLHTQLPVAQANQLGDARLAAEPAPLVQLHATSRDEQKLRAVEERLPLALELGANEVRQRPPQRRPGRERQRQV